MSAPLPDAPSAGRPRNPILPIFLTVFLDLLSFGLFIPDLQLRGQEIARATLGPGASRASVEVLVGIMLAIYSLAQLLFAPMLGRLSDRIGRRKILLLTCVLAVLSYVLYAHATSIPIILMARILSGIAAANLGVAFAYIADVTKPEDRAKSLGAIGAAFGLGFIFGPPLGGYLIILGKNEPLLLGYVGAALAVVNLIYIALFLPESLKTPRLEKSRFFDDLVTAVRTPGLAVLLLMFFAINIAFTNLETTYFRLLAEPGWVFSLGDEGAKRTGSLILGLVGVVGAIMQGGVIRIVTPKYGEVRLLRFAYLLYIPVFAAIPFLPLTAPALIGVVLLGVCSGLAQPSLSSLVSRSAPSTIQGGIFGITQALGALARFLGPLISSPLFSQRPYLPYVVGSAIILIPAVLSWRVRMPVTSEDGEPVVAAAH